MSAIAMQRQFFAGELRVTYGLTSSRLVAAIADVPRERFVGPGPWSIRGPHDQRPRQTDSDDPALICHDVVVAIDVDRNLFNGQPSLIAGWLQALDIQEGARVLHVGCATGYYTAWIASIVGRGGRVVAVDVDAELAARARANLAEFPWVEVHAGDGVTNLPSGMDVVIVHAGASHVRDEWLDALAPNAKLLVPLTAAFPGMPANISKGLVLNVSRNGDEYTARLGMPLAIYTMVGARSDEMQQRLGKAMMTGTFNRVTRLRRDPHEPEASCWMHGPACLSIGSDAPPLDRSPLATI